MSRKFLCLEQKYPSTPQPFKIVEVFESCDGYRSRLTDTSFFTEQQAMDEITELEHRYKKEINVVRVK